MNAEEPSSQSKPEISEKVLAVTEIQRMRAEVRLLSEQLNNWEPLKQQFEYLGEDPKAHWKRLMAGRAEAIQKLYTANKHLVASAKNKEAAGSGVGVRKEILEVISDLLIPWQLLDWSGLYNRLC